MPPIFFIFSRSWTIFKFKLTFHTNSRAHPKENSLARGTNFEKKHSFELKGSPLCLRKKKRKKKLLHKKGDCRGVGWVKDGTRSCHKHHGGTADQAQGLSKRGAYAAVGFAQPFDRKARSRVMAPLTGL